MVTFDLEQELEAAPQKFDNHKISNQKDGKDSSLTTLQSAGRVDLEEESSNSSDDDDDPAAVETSTSSFRERASAKMDEGFSQLFGQDYSSRESKFVIVMGALIAFNMGFVNGTCMSGFLAHDGTRQMVAGLTGAYTDSALSLASGNIRSFGDQSCVILSYLLGSTIPGFMTPEGKPYQMEPSYGPTFFFAGALLMIGSVLAFLEQKPLYIFCFVIAANGCQNGIASIYSANLIRVSTLGATTDMGLYLGKWLRTGTHTKEFYKRVVLAMIVTLFWLGAFVSYYAAKHFLVNTLFFNAGLFFLIGAFLVFYLVNEIGMSIQAAMLGSWKWKKAMEKISQHQKLEGKSLVDVFDDIDKDLDGEIDASELLEALTKAGVSIGEKEARILIRAADLDGNGTIDRGEWIDLVNRISGEASSSSPETGVVIPPQENKPTVEAEDACTSMRREVYSAAAVEYPPRGTEEESC